MTKISIPLISILLTILTETTQRYYKYYYFNDIIKTFENLQKTCPEYVRIDTSQKRYNLDVVTECDGNCTNLIVYLTDFDSYTLNRPQFYISGLVHGNEELGPTTITEFVLYFCNNKNKKNKLFHNILKSKLYIMTPMTNAYGYYHETREDRVIYTKNNSKGTLDPNRDFPYSKGKNLTFPCMRTLSGRTINEIFNEHIISGGLTFHGGDNVIGYAWGNFIHISNHKSTEAPDHEAFNGIGKIMKKVTSSLNNTQNKIDDYLLGDMTSLVYAVDGGLEDWAYALNWENKIIKDHIPIKKCDSNTFSYYNEDWNIKNEHKGKCLMYLIEADKNKKPKENTLGIEDFEKIDIFDFFNLKNFFGHIPRNMRLIYASSDLMYASIFIDNENIIKDGNDYKIPFIIMGCKTVLNITIYKTNIYLLDKDYLNQNFMQKKILEKNIYEKVSENISNCYWGDYELGNNLTTYNLIIKNSSQDDIKNETIKKSIKGNLYFIHAVAPDYNWRNQNNPDPKINPQSHLVNSKINSSFFIENGNYSLSSNYHILSYPIITLESGKIIIVDDIDSLFYSIEENDIIFIISELSNLPSNYYITTFVNTNTSMKKKNYLASEMEFIFDLNIIFTKEESIENYNKKLIKSFNTEIKQVMGKISLNNLQDELELSTIECSILTNPKKEYLIKCMNILKNYNLNNEIVNGKFVRERLANSLISIVNEKEIPINLIGIFSLDKKSKGRFLLDYDTSYFCSSNLFYNFPKETEVDYKIEIKRKSNKELQLIFNSKNVKYEYLVLFPFAHNYMIFNNKNNTGQIKLNEKADGKIIGKSLFVIKLKGTQSLDFIKNFLKNDTEYMEFIFGIKDLFKNDLIVSKCSIYSNRLLSQQNLNIFDKIAPWNISSIEINYIKKQNFIKYCIIVTVVIALLLIILIIYKKIRNKVKTIDYDEVKVISTSETSTNS